MNKIEVKNLLFEYVKEISSKENKKNNLLLQDLEIPNCCPILEFKFELEDFKGTKFPFVILKDKYGNYEKQNIEIVSRIAAEILLLCDNYEYLEKITKYSKGVRNKKNKLKEGDVEDIRKLLAANVSQRKIAKKYGVSQPLITKINKGDYWKT